MSLVIALTGSTGFIGNQLAPYLINQGHRIIELGRKPAGFGQFISIDESHEKIAESLETLRVSHLIHLAGFAHRSSNAHEMLRDNVNLTQKIVAIANAAPIQRTIYMSSIKALGNTTQGVALSHTSRPEPTDGYGKSKLACEALIESSSRSDWVIIRPPLVYGQNAKGNIARLNAWCSAGRPFPLGGLLNKRAVISIENLCFFTSLCLIHPEAIKSKWLVSDGTNDSTSTIYQKICKDNKKQPQLVTLPQWFWRLAQSIAYLSPTLESLIADLEVDISYTSTRLGWAPHGAD